MRSMWNCEAAMHCVNARARRRARRDLGGDLDAWGSGTALIRLVLVSLVLRRRFLQFRDFC